MSADLTIPKPAGSTTLKIIKELVMQKGMVQALKEVHDDLVRKNQPALTQLSLFGNNAVFVGEPDLIKHIFHNSHIFDKPSRLFDPLRELMMESGLITAQYEQWQKQHQYARTSFSGVLMKNYAQIMMTVSQQYIVEALKQVPSGETVNMDEILQQATLQSLFRCMFNIEDRQSPLNEEQIEVILVNLDKVFNYSFAKYFVPTVAQFAIRSLRNDFDHAIDETHPVLSNAVTQYVNYIQHNNITEPWDIISGLIINGMQAETETERMSFEEVCSNVVTFMVAGFDTAKSLLKTMMRYSAQVQGIDTQIREDMTLIPLLMKEALRYECPVHVAVRETQQDAQLLDYHLPAGTLIVISQHITHHDARFWSNPEQFDIHRFNADPPQPYHPYAYFPFTEGARKCLGMRFGQMETEQMFSDLLQHFRWEVMNPNATGTYQSTFQRPLTVRIHHE